MTSIETTLGDSKAITTIDENGLNRMQTNVFNDLLNKYNTWRMRCLNDLGYYFYTHYFNLTINHYPRYLDNITASYSSLNYTTENNGLISNNVSDVFIYDCNEESSCNSLWRTNSSLSWHDEKGKFPDKILIAVSSSGMDIIDASIDEIWMRFELNGTTISDSAMIGHSSYYPKNVKVINGTIYLSYDNDYGLRIIDFANDTAYYYYNDQV